MLVLAGTAETKAQADGAIVPEKVETDSEPKKAAELKWYQKLLQ